MYDSKSINLYNTNISVVLLLHNYMTLDNYLHLFHNYPICCAARQRRDHSITRKRTMQACMRFTFTMIRLEL